jgi:alpha-tubulin suppressor-like RCC1 family protein/uncharacterized protein YjdB
MKNLFTGLGIAAALALAAACGSDSGGPTSTASVAVSGVGVSPNTANMTIGGGTRTLEASVYPLDAANRNVTWSSSNPSVAAVVGDGRTATVTALAVGKVAIRATAADGGKTATCEITVGDGLVHATGLEMPSSLSIVRGAAGLLAAGVLPPNAADQGVTWRSSNESCAKVDGAGPSSAFVTGVADGTATITATADDGGWTAACLVTVGPYTVPALSITLDRTAMDLSIIGTGGRRSITATLQPPNATPNVIWTSSNPAVATVPTAQGVIGTVTPVGAGSTTITATINGMTATCAVQVENRPSPVRGVTGTAACGYQFTVAIKANGEMWSWGANNVGNLGLGDTVTPRNTPQRVGMDTNWAAVSATYVHTAALKTDGSLWVWGSNSDGQLGQGGTSTASLTSPVQVGADYDWATVSAGSAHTVALRRDGSLWVWVGNSSGQLRLGNSTTQRTPVRLGTDSDWAFAYAGYYHTLAIKADGSLWTTGYNGEGLLGVGDNANKNVLTRVSGGDWAAAVGSSDHSVALKTDGTLWAWGGNSRGQVGDSTTANRNVPVRISADTNWATVSCGNTHSVAFRSNGSIWTWGWGTYGQLSSGGTANRTSPGQVGTETNWALIVTGGMHTLAVKRDGTLWTCGYNSAGQIGDGTNGSTTYDRREFVQVGTGYRVPN